MVHLACLRADSGGGFEEKVLKLRGGLKERYMPLEVEAWDLQKVAGLAWRGGGGFGEEVVRLLGGLQWRYMLSQSKQQHRR